MRALVPLAATCLLLYGAAPGAPSHRATPASAIQPYRSWHCTTPQPVDMVPRIAVLCIGPASWDASPANPHVPHLYKVYVNPIGKAAMLSQKPMAFPVGSIIVKEKFAAVPARKKNDFSVRKLVPNAKPELLTVMIKREKGFSPANGDWEYQALTGDAQTQATLGLQHCAKCHQTASQRDYVWTRKLSTPYPNRTAPLAFTK